MDAEKKQLKNLYLKLVENENSVLFAVDQINTRLLNRLKKSSYDKDQVFYKLFKKLENEEKDIIEPQIPFYTPFIEQRKDIDRSSALYTVNGPLQFFHADLAYLQFFAKSAVDPKYALLCVDLFTSKVYVYTLRTKNNLFKKLEEFYEEIDIKRVKNEKMRLQVDLEFQQNKIKELNKKYNVEMFTTKNRGGKAYAAEQKIREFKKILFKIKKTYKRLKKRLNSAKLIKKTVQNMNNTKSIKYGFEPEVIERQSLTDENFKERYDFHRLNQITKAFKRYKQHDLTVDFKRKKKLRDPLTIGERVLILASRLKKKDAPGVLYKSTTENKPFFSKKQVYVIRKIVKITDIFHSWISEEGKNQIIPNRFFREELFALSNQFQ